MMSLERAEQRDRKISRRKKHKTNSDWIKRLKEKQATIEIKKKRQSKINKT